jgi:hypothetical protein
MGYKTGLVMYKKWWLLDTGYGTGTIVEFDGYIVDSAPIFKKFRGYTLSGMKGLATKRGWTLKPDPGTKLPGKNWNPKYRF